MEETENLIEYWHDGEKYRYNTTIRDDTVAGHPVKMTSFHTVVDPTWSISYILDVQEAERRTCREICGTPKKNGTPCCKYPLSPDEDPYPSEVGRCELHRPSMQVETSLSTTSERNIVTSKPSLPDTPGMKMVLDVADHFYMRCGNCIHRNNCEDRGENNAPCVQEKLIFESILGELVRENNLDSMSDQLTALSVADTMLKIIRTSSYETRYGIIESINTGTAQQNINLNKLLFQGLKLLGVDRRTRITVRRGSGAVDDVGGSIAKALSHVNITEIEVKEARMKIDSRQRSEEIVDIGPPIGLDGKVIKDDI